MEKCGITICITVYPSKSTGNRKVFPGFHRVFHRIERRCNIQQLSTGYFDSQMCDLQIVIIRVFGVTELKLFTKNIPEIYINDKLCTGFPPTFSTCGGIKRYCKTAFGNEWKRQNIPEKMKRIIEHAEKLTPKYNNLTVCSSCIIHNWRV